MSGASRSQLSADSEPDFGFTTGLSFRGWLPTVTGRLSFSVFGQTSHPTRTTCENVSDSQCRHVLVSQERPTGDAIIPSIGIETRFLFILLANTVRHKTQDYLSGRAYIVDRPNWKSAKEHLEVYKTCLQTARFEVANGAVLESIISKPEKTCINALDSHAAFSVDVRICRTGTTDIKCNIPTLSSNRIPSLPVEPLPRAKMVRALSSQIFFFLKDIGHHHQHHDSTTDTITDLHPTTGLDPSNLNWRSQTLYSIYRKIIEYKRQPNQKIFYDCLGLLAYANTFREISKEELTSNLSDQLPVYYAEEVSQSIEATQSKNERATEERRYFEDRRTNIFIGCFGVLIAYIGLMQFADVPKIEPSFLLDVFVTKLLKYPVLSLIFFLALIYQDYPLKWFSSGLGLKILRLLSPLKREWSVLAFLVLIAICLFLIILLIRSL